VFYAARFRKVKLIERSVGFPTQLNFCE